ncbi:MAG: hypothetical protein ABR611_07185 [Chthoniobacterales bacterium]
MNRLLKLVTDISSDLAWAPLFWPFVFFIPFFCLFCLRRYRPELFAGAASWVDPIYNGLAGLVLVGFLAADLSYCLSSAFWDHNESSFGIQSWMSWRGDAVYQNLLTEQRYSGPYGPYGYMVVGLCQGLIGPGVFATKFLPCIAGAATLGSFYLVLRRRTSARVGLLLTSLLAALALRLGPFAFWSRPDPFLLLCVTTGLLAATRKSLANTVLLGIALGVAVNLKIDSALYFIPVAMIAIRTGFDRAALIKVATIALVAIILPFILFHQISLGNYLGILRLVGKRNFGLLEFRLSLEWLVTLSVPLILGLRFYKRTSQDRPNEMDVNEKRYLAAIVVASVAILIFASKRGAGPHHFLPLIPIILFFAAERRERGRRFQWGSSMVGVTGYALCFSWLLSCTLVAFGSAYSLSTTAIRNEAEAAAAIRDLQQLVDEHPAYTWLGGAPLGGLPVDSTFHLQLVFKGMPPGVIPPAQMDFQLAHFREVDLTRLEKEIVEKYRRPIAWVVPKGSLPVGMKTAFDQSRPLFSEKFQHEFADRFEKTGATRFFDFYTPKAKREM